MKEGERMPTYEYNKKYADKYLEKLEEFKVRVPKGEKDKIKAHAAQTGESVNAFIIRAIAEAMARDARKESEA
jgi:predicted HicB family RNase H-like nuclease